MLITLKWVGTAANLTTNQNYVVLGLDAGGCFVIDDNNVPYFAPAITSTSDWQLVSVTAPGVTQVYP